MRRNRSKIRRFPHGPFVFLLGMVFSVALIALIAWPRQKAKPVTVATSEKVALQKAALSSAPSVQGSSVTPVEDGEIKTLRGTVSGAFSKSLRDLLDKSDVDFMSSLATRMLIWRLDIRRQMEKGDTFQIAYRRIKEQSKFEILAMTYQSKKRNQTFRFYQHKEASRRFPSYYDEAGEEIELQLKNPPLREYQQVTSILKMRPKHKGVDFKTPVGTPLYMPFDGKVIRTNWNFRYNGSCIEVALLNKPNVRVLFLHLDKIMASVKPGKVFRAGQILGSTGNTGRSTAPHLHYQIMTAQGKILDPYTFHETYKRSLPESELPAFQASRQRFDHLFGASTN